MFINIYISYFHVRNPVNEKLKGVAQYFSLYSICNKDQYICRKMTRQRKCFQVSNVQTVGRKQMRVRFVCISHHLQANESQKTSCLQAKSGAWGGQTRTFLAFAAASSPSIQNNFYIKKAYFRMTYTDILQVLSGEINQLQTGQSYSLLPKPGYL